jgi:hypothetical protein
MSQSAYCLEVPNEHVWSKKFLRHTQTLRSLSSESFFKFQIFSNKPLVFTVSGVDVRSLFPLAFLRTYLSFSPARYSTLTFRVEVRVPSSSSGVYGRVLLEIALWFVGGARFDGASIFCGSKGILLSSGLE